MRILIVLVPGFSHLSLGAVLEPLSLVAQMEGGAVTLGSVSELLVPSSSGVAVTAELALDACVSALGSASRPDAMVLCCGLRTPYKSQGDIRRVLRAAHRAGVAILGTGCAAWKMADAGLLQHGAGTAHWSTLPAFAERHRDIAAKDALFVTSAEVTSTPGEAAALDMVMAFIEARCGAGVAQEVSQQLMIGHRRPGEAAQPRDRAEALRDAPSKLRQMVEVMGAHLEAPLRVRDVAAEAGLSLRQAERLFQRYLGRTPKQYYRWLRVQHGRMLIEQTSLSILEISLAAGFSSRRTFTQLYRETFGFPPAHTRRTP